MFTSTIIESKKEDKYVIGVDVGGTNTDAVLLKNGKIIGSHKATTTDYISDGIKVSISGVLKSCPANKVKQVMVGTTHLLNALLQRRVESVGIIRLAKPATNAIPPLTGWPEDLAKAVNGFVKVVSGGYEYNGQVISKLDTKELEAIAKETISKKIQYIAITGVYSHVNPHQEIQAASFLKKINPNLIISLSYQREGELLERENATIIDAALKKVCSNVCEGIKSVLHSCGIDQAQLFLTHNDGTLSLVTDNVSDIQPIVMLKSGATNSLRGAGFLAASNKIAEHCIVADIGGTSTDVGILVKGAPSEKNALFELAGVKFKFPSTEVQSISLGGGSTIVDTGHGIRIDKSIANKLSTDGVCFGGKVLTATDIAIAKRRIMGNSDPMRTYSSSLIDKADSAIHTKLAEFINEVIASVENKPKTLVLVGGGAALFDRDILLKMLSKTITHIDVPEFASVANATGASTAEISGTHIEIYDYKEITREEAIADATKKAIKHAIKKGATPDSISVKNKEEVQIRYVVGSPTQVRVKVSGKVNPNHIPRLDNTSDNDSIYQDLINGDIKDNTTDEHKKELITDSNVNENFEVTTEINQHLLTIKPLTIDDISARSIGHAFLGSGGGGDTRISEIIVKQSIKTGKKIKVLSLNKLPDDANVIAFGLMGSPSVFEEKIPSSEEMISSVMAIQQKLGKKIDAIVVLEGGGTNGLLPYFAGAELGLPIINADTMGRAFPGIDMVTPTIYNHVKYHVAALANIKKVEIVIADSAKELEDKARKIADSMGGVVYISYLPMDGKTAKKVCIPSTLTIAHQIGELFLKARNQQENPLDTLNEYLKNTEYEEAKEIFKGRIDDVRRVEEGAFSVGGILVTNDSGKSVEVIFQNESLLAREKLPNGLYKKLAEVPDLITIVDQESYEPISTPQLCYGLKVRLLTLQAPKILKTKEALAVVGPQVFGLLNRSDDASPLICNSLFNINSKTHDVSRQKTAQQHAVKHDDSYKVMML